MSTERRQKWLTVFAVACVVLLVADRVVIGPLVQRFQTRAQTVRQLAADATRAKALLDQSDAWQGRLRDFHGRSFPSDPSEAESLVVKSVRDWASRSGLALTSMRPRWRSESDERPTLELRVTGTGQIGAVTGFLFAAETAPTPLRTVAVTVSASASRPTDLTLSAELHAVLVEEAESEPKPGGTS